MDLVNKTHYSTGITATIVEKDRMMGSVIVKALLDIKDGSLHANEVQDWPIGEEVETEFGKFDPESPFRKQGIDLMLLGKAYPMERRAQNQTRVTLSVDEFTYSMDVLGDRRWVNNGKQLVATAAAPFDSIPLTWERAYGGKCPVETGELPFHQNADGRGFFLDKALAENGMLPNLEDPANPIRNWEDQPVPVGVAPLSRVSALRAMNSVEMDLDSKPPKIKSIKPSYFNNANPALILQSAPKQGARVRVSSVRPGGAELAFSLTFESLHVYVQLADRGYVFPANLDSVVILSETEQVLLGYRCCFKYTLHPLERRAAILYSGSLPDSVPEPYRIDWESFDYSEVVNG